MILRIIAGIAIGVLWEMGVVNYTRAVIERKRWIGAGITVGLGLASLLWIAMLAWKKVLDLPLAFIAGEALGTFIFIGKPKKDG